MGHWNPISDHLGITMLDIVVARTGIRQVIPYHRARWNHSTEVTGHSGYQRLQGKGKSLSMSGLQHSRTLYAKQKSIAVDKAVLQENKYYLEEKFDPAFHNEACAI